MDTGEFWGSTVPVRCRELCLCDLRVEIQMGIWIRGCSNRRAGMAKEKMLKCRYQYDARAPELKPDTLHGNFHL